MNDSEFLAYVGERLSFDPRGRFNAEELDRLYKLALSSQPVIAPAPVVDTPEDDHVVDSPEAPQA